MVKNDRWRYYEWPLAELPEKARRFIDLMNLDVNRLKIVILNSDPQGTFFKGFDNNERAVYDRNDIIYLVEDVSIGLIIHELTHFYFEGHNHNHDVKAIGETFIKKHGLKALSKYAITNIERNRWDEVVCEIVATYGRRGQFDKILELFK